MGVAAQHWACDIKHSPARGYRKGREHRVGCAVESGHDADRPPFRCRVCSRKYRPPQTERRLMNASIHYACTLERAEHVPPVELYSKSGHRLDCPTNPPHVGKQGSSCIGCRMIYRGEIGLPFGKVNDSPHWDCHLPPEAHVPKPMYGIGHRPGCAVAEGHEFGKTLRGCRICRRVAGQGNTKSARLKKQYSLSREDYEAMIERQGGACAICHKLPSVANGPSARGLAVDHDHVSGRIRGLLCYACNLGLGYFRDDPTALLDAVVYLRGHTEA